MHCKRDHMSVPSLSKKLQMNFSISDLELISTIVATLASSYLNTLCDFLFLDICFSFEHQELSRWRWPFFLEPSQKCKIQHQRLTCPQAVRTESSQWIRRPCRTCPQASSAAGRQNRRPSWPPVDEEPYFSDHVFVIIGWKGNQRAEVLKNKGNTMFGLENLYFSSSNTLQMVKYSNWPWRTSRIPCCGPAGACSSWRTSWWGPRWGWPGPCCSSPSIWWSTSTASWGRSLQGLSPSWCCSRSQSWRNWDSPGRKDYHSDIPAQPSYLVW